MSRAPITTLALRSVFNRRLTAFLTVLTVAIAVCLFLSVQKVRDGARDSFENTISGTDLIVGARSSPVNLLLYSVFHIGDATNNITWDSYQAVANAPGVAWTVPLSLGDSHRGYRVVGTNNDLFARYEYGHNRQVRFEQGQALDQLFDVVLGASVAGDLGYDLGDSLVLAHGGGEVGFIEHDHNPFTVVGILAPTGTPLDRSLFVSLEAIEAIHVAGPTGRGMDMDHHDHSHEGEPEGDDHAAAYDLEALQPDQITAFLVGLNSPVAALRLQRAVNTYPQEALQAIIPGLALAQLWGLVSIAEKALTIVAAFVVASGLITILISILTSLNERRREMAILRALGARPGHIFVLLVSEAGILAALGAVTGLLLTYGGLYITAPIVEAEYGFALPAFSPNLNDLALVGIVTLAAGLLGMIPAWRAYRNSLADGMSIRL
ncbi:ABC transporter permease [Woodsholea maritima]|uniref:ABC transporter permease n=1 Tax=Woodsholea maritima TaxID=240237 RepID=UPI0003624FC0|nr:ABC transporter permease [Woodsholea maritima]